MYKIMDEYKYTLNVMLAWFLVHSNDVPKYYEYTMRELITEYTYKKILESDEMSVNAENNIIRLIEDNKIFIIDHLKNVGIIRNQL